MRRSANKVDVRSREASSGTANVSMDPEAILAWVAKKMDLCTKQVNTS